jgi:hypothetical protein
MRPNLLGLICLSALLLHGCIFSPKKGTEKPPPPQPYERPSSPEAVIRNLALAYQQKDSLNYVACFDAGYTGSSIDQTNPNPQLISVTWASEAAHIGSITHSSISSITAETIPNLDQGRFHDSGDNPGWDTIQNPFNRIDIVDPAIDVTWSIPFGTGELNIFKFKGTKNAGAADSTWKIIFWQEVRN